METTAPPQARPRSPIAACLLTLLSAGLGQIYCGRLAKGLALYLAVLLTSCLGILAVVPGPQAWRAATLTVLAASMALWLYAFIDAYRLARRSSPAYVPADYNRWYVYAILAVLPLPISIGAALLVRQGVAQAVRVTSSCMSPTIHLGDRVLVDKLAYTRGPIVRGDIIVFINPDRRDRLNIKRVVALPGDTVQITGDELVVNGTPFPHTRDQANEVWEHAGPAAYRVVLPSSPADQPATAPAATLPAGQPATAPAADLPLTTVPHGHCFVLSDQRRDANDSRRLGPVPLRDVVGRAEWVYWPPARNIRPHQQ